MRKFRVLAICANDSGAPAHYRGQVPLLELERAIPDRLEVMAPWGGVEINPNRLRAIDAVFLHTPSADHHVATLEMAKNLGIPIWVDIDDWMFGIPESSSYYELHQSGQTKGYLDHCLKIADVVTTTTPALAEMYRKWNPNTVVIPNAFDSRLLGRFRIPPPPIEHRKNTILWRGSNSHDEDLEILGHILPYVQEFPEWKWVFLGHKPWRLTRELPEGSWGYMPWTDIVGYHQTLMKLQPRITVVPLADHPFNRGKSSIAWMEASMANSVVIAPDWPEWHRPGVVNYFRRGDSTTFHSVLNAQLRARTHVCPETPGWQYVEENLLLTQVNALREKVLVSLGMRA